jgi:4-amino-4-deoxy-L-arabinose transferase-like glycosyltransferase
LALGGLELEIGGWLAFYVVALTGIHLFSHGSGNLHNDTLEAYAWGRELQLGYPKHPPFWAWVADVWFNLFPTADWAAYLLASLNAAIGLGCSWLIGRRFLPPERAMAAFYCLTLTSSYLCFAQRFNANTILLSLWPATTLFTLRAVERNRLRDGFCAGLLAALCMLSKYQSAIFLTTLFVAVYFIKGMAQPYRSKAAWICYAVALTTVIPHLIWLRHTGFLPILYMRVTTIRPWPIVARESVTFLFAAAGYVAPAVIAYAWAGRHGWRTLSTAFTGGFRGKRRAVAILAFGVPVLTLAICLIRSSTVKTAYAIPMLFMLPIWFAMAPQLAFDNVVLGRIRSLAGGLILFLLIASPIVGVASFKIKARFATRPKDEIADAVTAAWHRQFGKPLRIVAGDEDYAIAVPFYSDDHPSYVIGFDERVLADFGLPMSGGRAGFVPRLSPWSSIAAIDRDGLAIVCAEEAWHSTSGCVQEAVQWVGRTGLQFELTAAEQHYWFAGPAYRFQVFFLPPH